MTNSDELLTQYLLGELPESEQSRLEERYFNDPKTFEQIVQLEADLIDSYNRGKLPPELRLRFERAYLSNPDRSDRVKFSAALTTNLDQRLHPPTVQPVPVDRDSWWRRLFVPTTHRALAFSMALALLLVSTATLWFWVQTRRLQQQLANARAEENVQEQRSREVQRELNDARSKADQLSAELEHAQSENNSQTVPTSPRTQPSAIATLVLMISGVRGSETGAAPRLIIHKDTQQVRLQLRLHDTEFPNYILVLNKVGGNEVYYGHRAKPAGKSAADFVITLPAAKLSAGDFLLTLKGQTAAGDIEDLSQSLFRVERD
ncbi:MAG TPA: hypothetical protein VFC63_08135 [Blastocatellia bacterium]|nr:hypothetical protein [Blastocatellia bacterium]